MEQEQAGKERAKYGQALIEALADELTKEYGKNFSKRNLQYFRKFYLAFTDGQIVIEHPLIALQRCISLRCHTACRGCLC